MLKFLAIIISVILSSCYCFPFGISGGMNTKMLMAVMSLAILSVEIAQKRDAIIDKSFLILSIYGIGVTLASIASTIYNNTQDYSYVTYFISMWVWLGGAYTLIKCIGWLNGKNSVEIICNYIIGICTFQCVIAYLIDMYPLIANIAFKIDPGLKDVVNYIDGRLFGIGCAFDVAGIRLSCGLVILAFMIYKTLQKEKLLYIRIILYFLSFAIITVIGNMISRTTIVGCGLFWGYLVLMYIFNNNTPKTKIANKRLFYSCMLCVVVIIPIILYLYNINATFRTYFRFGFEGFFSLIEENQWKVESNEILWTMYRFPETLKTWVIGDGYMLSANNDPNYLGPIYLGYYKGTDVGYLRFIYYFGIMGLIPCVLQMGYAAYIGIKRLPEFKMIYIMLLLVNLICWFKVSTDAFAMLAIFAVYGMMYSGLEEDNQYG